LTIRSIKTITDTLQRFFSGSAHLLHSYQKLFLLENMGGLTPTSTKHMPINNFTKDEFKDALEDARQVLFLMRLG
jgi:hypothetical protein